MTCAGWCDERAGRRQCETPARAPAGLAPAPLRLPPQAGRLNRSCREPAAILIQHSNGFRNLCPVFFLGLGALFSSFSASARRSPGRHVPSPASAACFFSWVRSPRRSSERCSSSPSEKLRISAHRETRGSEHREQPDRRNVNARIGHREHADRHRERQDRHGEHEVADRAHGVGCRPDRGGGEASDAGRVREPSASTNGRRDGDGATVHAQDTRDSSTEVGAESQPPRGGGERGAIGRRGERDAGPRGHCRTARTSTPSARSRA